MTDTKNPAETETPFISDREPTATDRFLKNIIEQSTPLTAANIIANQNARSLGSDAVPATDNAKPVDRKSLTSPSR